MSKETVAINGVKFEVDMDNAKRIDTFKVGDNVRLLDKSYSSSSIYIGVILGFYNFKDLPTIQVAYFYSDYSDTGIKFVNINSENKDFELLPANPYEADFDHDSVVESLTNEIEKAEEKVRSLKAKKSWFLKYYGQIFDKNAEGVDHE